MYFLKRPIFPQRLGDRSFVYRKLVNVQVVGLIMPKLCLNVQFSRNDTVIPTSKVDTTC